MSNVSTEQFEFLLSLLGTQAEAQAKQAEAQAKQAAALERIATSIIARARVGR